MKKKNLLFVFCFAGTITFSSCEKNLYDESKQPEKETTMTDLEVPANFTWVTSQKAKCEINTPVATRIYVYLDKDCKENDFLLKMDVDQDTKDLPLPMEIPAYTENVYVKYEGGTNMLTVPVSNDGTISISLPADAKTPTAKAVTRADGKGDYTPQPGSGDNSLVYPGNGYGTVFFEDMYPKLGDYDFNDFVAWYLLQIPKFSKDKNVYSTKIMYIGFQIRAIGGVYDYDPYIRMTDVKYSDLDWEETQIYGEGVEIIEGPNGEAIISYTKPAIPEGYKYFNTQIDELTKPGELTAVYLAFKSPMNLDKLQDSKVDIYLAKKNHGQEIHLKGYSPVYGDPNTKYFNEKNFVWGLKVPESLPHAIEGTDFLDAYPNFEKWVTSGGQNVQHWWNRANDDKLIYLE